MNFLMKSKISSKSKCLFNSSMSLVKTNVRSVYIGNTCLSNFYYNIIQYTHEFMRPNIKSFCDQKLFIEVEVKTIKVICV